MLSVHVDAGGEGVLEHQAQGPVPLGEGVRAGAGGELKPVVKCLVNSLVDVCGRSAGFGILRTAPTTS